MSGLSEIADSGNAAVQAYGQFPFRGKRIDTSEVSFIRSSVNLVWDRVREFETRWGDLCRSAIWHLLRQSFSQPTGCVHAC